MKDYIILNNHRKFCEIWPENKALELIWSCQHDEDSAEILGKPSQKFRIRETLTLSMCADSRTKINPIWHLFCCTFRHFFTFWVYFAFVANVEVACHSQDYLKLCAIVCLEHKTSYEILPEWTLIPHPYYDITVAKDIHFIMSHL